MNLLLLLSYLIKIIKETIYYVVVVGTNNKKTYP